MAFSIKDFPYPLFLYFLSTANASIKLFPLYIEIDTAPIIFSFSNKANDLILFPNYFFLSSISSPFSI